MRATLLLLVVLSAFLISETEAGWWRRLVRRIKDRCRIENGRITCTFGRRKRAVEDEPAFGDGNDGGSSVDCDSHLENGGVPMMPFIDTFESVDQNDDGALNATEYVKFKEILDDIYGVCFDDDIL